MSDLAITSLSTLRTETRADAVHVCRGEDADRAQPATRRAADRAEISAAATYLAKIRALPPVRQDLVDSVRAQIKAGEYDTPEKLDAAIEDLLSDL